MKTQVASSDIQTLLNIDSVATKEIQNDVLILLFTASESGDTSFDVQRELREKVAEAMAIVRPLLKVGEVEAETTGFSVGPIYDKKAKITGYRGIAQLTVKGTDTATISSLASQIVSMAVAGTSNDVSRAAKLAIEESLTAEAVKSFQAKANLLTQLFGFSSYVPQSLQVSCNASNTYGRRGGGQIQMAAAASLESGGSAGSAMETESGKSEFSAVVRGAIVLL